MTQAQQPEALRIAMHLRSRAQISSTPGNLDTLSASAANELERQHARILELEQGKCLHQIAEPAAPHAARDLGLAALEQYLKECEENQIVADVGGAFAYAWQRAAAPQAVTDEREAFVNWLHGTYPNSYSIIQAADLWFHKHVAALAWKARAALAATQPATQGLDAHPAEGVPAQDVEAKIAELLALARIMVRTALDADNKTQVQEIKAAIESEVAFERALRAALAATQPAAQGMDAKDAARYRFIKKHSLILSGGTREFGWPISPFGVECDRYIDKELAAQAKQGGV